MKFTLSILALTLASTTATSLRGSSFLDLGATDCSAAADTSAFTAIKSNLGVELNDCAGLNSGCVSILKGVDQSCVNTCMVTKKSFTASCSPAFGTLADCGFKNCKSSCISGDPAAESCVKCNEEKLYLKMLEKLGLKKKTHN